MPSDEAPVLPESPQSSAADVHRLHPLSLLFQTAGSLRTLVLPLVLFLFFSPERGGLGAGRNLTWVGWFVGISVIIAVVKYISYRYCFAEKEMIVTGGVLFRFERHIPYERIQNIDLVQNVFHRLLRVADVKIETASGARSEAQLQVLSVDAVERMRQRVFAEREPGSELPGDTRADEREVEKEVTLLQLKPRDLVTFGLLSGRGLAVVLAGLGLAYELDLFREEQFKKLEQIDPFAVEALPGLDGGGLAWPWIAAAGILFALMALRLLSVLWAFWTLHRFTLTRSGDDLRTSCGLFTRFTATIPRGRIQAITVTEGWAHRLFGYAAVKVDTAGGSHLEGKAATRSWVAPLIARNKLGALFDELQPGLSLEGLSWLPVDPCARTRLARRYCLLLILLSAVAGWWWTPWTFLALPALCLGVVWLARRQVAVMCYGMDGTAFAVQRGLWTRTTSLMWCGKIQVVDIKETPFDRRWGTASVGVDVAGTSDDIRVPFLGGGVAQHLSMELSAYAGRGG
jgi:putative membrane protein